MPSQPSGQRREALRLLGLQDPVEQSEVATAYRRLARQQHPGLGAIRTSSVLSRWRVTCCWRTTEVRGRALSKVVEADLGRLPSVRNSSARLVSADPPSLDAKVTTSLSCDLDELREHVTGVVGRLEEALGRSDVRMRIQIGFIDATESRVE